MVVPIETITIHAFLNQKEEALNYLREYEELENAFRFYDYILIDPLFENLRADPEFLEIVNKAQKEKAELKEQIEQLKQEGLLSNIMSEHRRHAAIVFTDIVGYTRLMGSDEERRGIAFQNRSIHQSCIEKFNGSLIKRNWR